MTNNSTNSPALQSEAETAGHLLDDWFDPIEAGLRDRVHEFIQVMIEAELEAARATPAAQGRFPRMLVARAVSRAIGTATDRGRFGRVAIGPGTRRAVAFPARVRLISQAPVSLPRQ